MAVQTAEERAKIRDQVRAAMRLIAGSCDFYYQYRGRGVVRVAMEHADRYTAIILDRQQVLKEIVIIARRDPVKTAEAVEAEAVKSCCINKIVNGDVTTTMKEAV